MASSPSAKRVVGSRNLLPFYVGITEGKDLKGTAYKHTHYVLIDEAVATRLGIRAKGISKPGAADLLIKGQILQTNRKKAKGDKKPITARRYITQSSKTIIVECKELVINSKRQRVQESYSIGFPSNVPLRLIIKFFATNCPNVQRISTGGNYYQVKK
jgi:hypothetical protein